MAKPKFFIINEGNIIGLGWECVSGRTAITYSGEKVNIKCPIEIYDMDHKPITEYDIIDLVDSSFPNKS